MKTKNLPEKKTDPRVRILILTALILLYTTVSYPFFDGGSGTADDPWQIATAVHLDNVRNYLGEENSDKHFRLTADIRLDRSPWNIREGWEPIGTKIDCWDIPAFHGHFDGAGHTIYGLYINRPEEYYQGLFGYTIGAEIANLKLRRVDVTANWGVGSLIGLSNYTKIDNIVSKGYVRGNVSVGGVTGMLGMSDLSNSHNFSFVSGEHNVGGVTGVNFVSEMVYCSNVGTIRGYESVGGLTGLADNGIDGGMNYDSLLFGYQHPERLPKKYNSIRQRNHYAIIDKCYNFGSIAGYYGVGGLTGVHYAGAVLKNSFSKGRVSGNQQVGGLIGVLSQIFTKVENCFSTGLVTGDTDVGGLAGYLACGYDCTVINSYWDIETSGQNTSAAGDRRLTVEMTYPYGDNTYADWDFAEIWTHDENHKQNNGYPYLQNIPLYPMPKIIPSLTELTAFPNPFNHEVKICFSLAFDCPVEVSIYDIRGRRIKKIEHYTQEGLDYWFYWDGKNQNGTPQSTGIYFTAIKSEGRVIQATKVLYLK